MLLSIRQTLSLEQWKILRRIQQLYETPSTQPIPAAASLPDTESRLYRMGDRGVQAPKALFQPLPEYTPEAKQARIEGIVLLKGIIRQNGRITDLRVLRGLGYGLEEAAIQTVSTHWQFVPGTLDGQPVDVEANFEISFRLY